jgi:tetratricopeptide (TPR) repeat protein
MGTRCSCQRGGSGGFAAPRSAPCVAPTQLEARVRAHPNADAYAALGIWYGNNHKSACEARAFQAGLKLEPDSPRLTYLLGLSLYTAGEPEESVTPLHHAFELDTKSEKAHLLLASALDGLGRSREAFVEIASRPSMHCAQVVLLRKAVPRIDQVLKGGDSRTGFPMRPKAYTVLLWEGPARGARAGSSHCPQRSFRRRKDWARPGTLS